MRHEVTQPDPYDVVHKKYKRQFEDLESETMAGRRSIPSALAQAMLMGGAMQKELDIIARRLENTSPF